jgi:gas vesicle protein
MKSEEILLGVLAGVAVGALLGILFAPDKGSVTRRKISKMGEGYSDVIKEKFEDFLENVTQQYEKVMEEVNDFTEKVKSDEKANA